MAKAIRIQLQNLAIPVADPGLKSFVPEGELDKIFNIEVLETLLSQSVFNIPRHKIISTARLVIEEAQKILAICLELNVEQNLITFIENDKTDAGLPLSRSELNRVVPEAAVRFEEFQWKYVAYRFRKGLYSKTLPKDRILPYIRQEHIGGGGFSRVFRVLVHPAHQDIVEKARDDKVSILKYDQP